MILGISTSLSQFCITLVNHNSRLIYHDQIERGMDGISIYEFITQALDRAKIDISEITNIVVDIGPGGTISVRTGVSFANGLSFSLNIPIVGISSAELMGIEAFKKYSLPVVILYKSVKDYYYCGIFNNNNIKIKYLKINDISMYINENFKKIVLAGYRSGIAELAKLLVSPNVVISDINKVNPYILGEKSGFLTTGFNKYPILPTPITEVNLL